jgi:hypothetical protein
MTPRNFLRGTYCCSSKLYWLYCSQNHHTSLKLMFSSFCAGMKVVILCHRETIRSRQDRWDFRFIRGERRFHSKCAVAQAEILSDDEKERCSAL